MDEKLDECRKKKAKEYYEESSIDEVIDDFSFFLDRMETMLFDFNLLLLLPDGTKEIRSFSADGALDILKNISFDLLNGYYRGVYSLLRQLRDITLLYLVIAFTPNPFESRFEASFEGIEANEKEIQKDEEWLRFVVKWMNLGLESSGLEALNFEVDNKFRKMLDYTPLCERVNHMLERKSVSRASEIMMLIEDHNRFLNNNVHINAMRILNPNRLPTVSPDSKPFSIYYENLMKIKDILSDFLYAAVGLFWLFDSRFFRSDDLGDCLDWGLPHEEFIHAVVPFLLELLGNFKERYPDKYSILVEGNEWGMEMPN